MGCRHGVRCAPLGPGLADSNKLKGAEIQFEVARHLSCTVLGAADKYLRDETNIRRDIDWRRPLFIPFEGALIRPLVGFVR